VQHQVKICYDLQHNELTTLPTCKSTDTWVVLDFYEELWVMGFKKCMKMVLGLVGLHTKIEDGIQYYIWFLKKKGHHKRAGPANNKDVVHLPTVSTL